MQQQRKTAWIVLISVALIIKIFSLFPSLVEQYYSRGIYPWIAKLQRLLLGWIPFSIGDLLYFAAGLFLIRGIFIILKKAFKRQITRQMLQGLLVNTLFIMLWVYVVFNALWGLNYNRVPMAERFNLKMDTYTTADLGSLVKLLGDSLNALDSSGIRDTMVLAKKATIFLEATNSYTIVEQQYPDLAYHPGSVKPSLYSYMGNYLGFSGYYNPFSGEAQVNTTVPVFVQPFVTCHEIGHQLGYAKEDEANFSGFLSARSSSSEAFLYSVYFDMYSYARRELYYRDSLRAREMDLLLRPRIRNDFKILKQFYQQYRNPLEPVIRQLYAGYLKANQQPKGMLSYNEVVAMLISYYRERGLLNITNRPI